MWVIYLEMGVAFALLILIVLWTWPAKRSGDARRAPDAHAKKEDAPR